MLTEVRCEFLEKLQQGNMILLDNLLAATNPECFPPRLPAGKQQAVMHKRLAQTGGFLPRFQIVWGHVWEHVCVCV